MEQFITFASIRAEHTYYSTPFNRYITLTPTLETKGLMKRRGLLFTEDADGWSWLMRKDCAGFDTDDLLELSMQISDANFTRVTRLADYHPQHFYQLLLGNKKNVDAGIALSVTKEKKWMAEFCRIRMVPTSTLWKKAQRDNPMSYTICFQSTSARWEYLFVMSNEATDNLQNLLLEETKNRIVFEKAERLQSPFGTHVWRTVSTSSVSALEHPEYRLVLSAILQEYPLKKRTVSRFIQCPQPGKYISDDPDMIREICYI